MVFHFCPSNTCSDTEVLGGPAAGAGPSQPDHWEEVGLGGDELRAAK